MLRFFFFLDIKTSNFLDTKKRKLLVCANSCLIFFADTSKAQQYQILFENEVTALLFNLDELVILRKVAL